MTKRMLIDATHEEETRVVILDGNRLEEFDFETSTKKQIKGNIYLAKVVRVEPSLQAAFVEYGGNRHGFLAFSEIHPDYYRIPVADREALLREHAAMAGGAEDGDEFESLDSDAGDPRRDAGISFDQLNGDAIEAARPDPDGSDSGGEEEEIAQAEAVSDDALLTDDAHVGASAPDEGWPDHAESSASGHAGSDSDQPDEAAMRAAAHALIISPKPDRRPKLGQRQEPESGSGATASDNNSVSDAAAEGSGEEDGAGEDSMGEDGGAIGLRRRRRPRRVRAASARISSSTGTGDSEDEAPRPRLPAYRRYKIQEVIKRRQILLVQVTKEERGNKGAALTTYLSLAGRYCVLMPNTARGGGISRKIGSAADRKRLKSILEDLRIPGGMAVIVRTAGSERSKAEVKRDYDYLMRLWEDIRTTTLRSTAPCLIHEEGNLIKRSIRDLYARDIDEVTVEGDDGYKTAKAFMRMLMPSHAKRVQPYRESDIPLLHRYQVENQLDAIFNPVTQLRSGGSIVIQPTEALVSIDVNSGRSTRERHIEETALKTNLEAAEEVARQLRLRDLAGLIVVDFIDMEENRHIAQVERRLRDTMKNDRARIQIGRISPFGLMELSRQRMRPSLQETVTTVCPHCAGSGFQRSIESTALHVLRAIEEEGIRRRSLEIAVHVPTAIALYILNQKRRALAAIEQRYGFSVMVAGDDLLISPDFKLERLRGLMADSEVEEIGDIAQPVERQRTDRSTLARGHPDRDQSDRSHVNRGQPDRSQADQQAADDEADGRPRRKRRRRRDDNRASDIQQAIARVDTGSEIQDGGDRPESETAGSEAAGNSDGDDGVRKRRRGKRGGRHRSRRDPNATGIDDMAADRAANNPADAGRADSDLGDDTQRASASNGGGQAATAPADSAGAATADTPKRPRRTRGRKPKAAEANAVAPPPAPQADAETSSADQPAVDGGAASANDQAAKPANGTDAIVDTGPKMVATVSGDGTVATDNPLPESEPERPKSPPRRGWWQRLLE